MGKRLKRTLAVLGLTFAATGLMTAAAAAAIAVEPRNTTPPTITGQARQGRVLTANNGTWANNPTTFAYQWQRCNVDGASCTNITGATQRTYTATAADVDRTLRVGVIASNADGGTTAYSAPTDVVSANTAPRNTARPTVTGSARVGSELAASTGTWTGGVRSYAYQWERCDPAGANCADVTGATGRTYGVRAADEGSTLRVRVTATNLAGSTSVTSDRTPQVTAGSTPPPPPPPPTANERPTITLLSVRFVGRRVYARMRICDDTPRNVTIFERDSRPGTSSTLRRFGTATPPNPCGVYTRNWAPASRFTRPGGRYTVTLWARDAGGKTSAQVKRTFVR